ncbi:STAS domain-containing protein [Streptacidiphilus sp. EB103A]|uniref:STAS domain-containing protein n=1 Tax=Streptacidiphilus sp. EB103A TaxID=3156275 RepID=UPI0035172E27
MDVGSGYGVKVILARHRVVTASGELDLVTAEDLRFDLLGGIRAGGGAMGAAGRGLVVDLLEVTFMDCAPLGVLCSARARAEHSGGWLRLVYAQDRITRLLTVTGLRGQFPRHATVADALANRPAEPVTGGSALR